MDNAIGKYRHKRFQTAQLLVMIIILLVILPVLGCSRVKYNVTSAPVRPEDTSSYRNNDPEVPVVVQIINFDIKNVDTQYSEQDKDLFRKHNTVSIPNLLQDCLGRRQVFSKVTRTESAEHFAADYVISGSYDFYSRLGTRGREWIPFAGMVGAPINEATIKGALSLRIVASKNRAVIFEKTFLEEHSEKTSVYKKPVAGYLQADYMGRITSEIIRAISLYNQ